MMLQKMILDRKNWLTEVIYEKKKALRNVPEGTLRATQHGKQVQFYHYTDPEHPHGKYLKSAEERLVRELAQKEYDQKVLNVAEKEQKILEKLYRLYQEGTVESVIEKIHLFKQEKIKPVRLTDENYVKHWLEIPYTGLEMKKENVGYYSDNGECMRSKSEVIIANLLNKRNIPYKYECPLACGEKKVYPDFTILNIRMRKELYWEHMGMMDIPEYREKNLEKIVRYQLNGYFPGRRLILSFETSQMPLNTKLIEKMIEEYCL